MRKKFDEFDIFFSPTNKKWLTERLRNFNSRIQINEICAILIEFIFIEKKVSQIDCDANLCSILSNRNLLLWAMLIDLFSTGTSIGSNRIDSIQISSILHESLLLLRIMQYFFSSLRNRHSCSPINRIDSDRCFMAQRPKWFSVTRRIDDCFIAEKENPSISSISKKKEKN